MRTRLPALLLALLALAACGKYGPPVRNAPSAAAPAAQAEVAPDEPDPAERDEGEEAPR
jgi:predicted small lipoprotein YifL